MRFDPKKEGARVPLDVKAEAAPVERRTVANEDRRMVLVGYVLVEV